MGKIYNSPNEPWMIYGEKFENFRTYESVYTDRNINPNYGNLTTTRNGIQKHITLDDYPLLVNDITKKVTECFTLNEMPFSVISIDSGWWINYHRNGYQSVHRHIRNLPEEYIEQFGEENIGICTALTIFDRVMEDSDDGQLYGLCGEDYYQFGAHPGDLWIFDSTVWHGVYPTKVTRRTMAFDLFYKIEE